MWTYLGFVPDQTIFPQAGKSSNEMYGLRAAGALCAMMKYHAISNIGAYET